MFNNIIIIATFHMACFHHTCMHRKAHICFILHLHVCHYLAPAPWNSCYLARHLKEVARACPRYCNFCSDALNRYIAISSFQSCVRTRTRHVVPGRAVYATVALRWKAEETQHDSVTVSAARTRFLHRCDHRGNGRPREAATPALLQLVIEY